nr:MAG TPA: hypothetical protein [Caudoviricetes sp.]
MNGEVINATVRKTVIRGFESHFNLKDRNNNRSTRRYCGFSNKRFTDSHIAEIAHWSERWHSSQRVGFDSLFPLECRSSWLVDWYYGRCA